MTRYPVPQHDDDDVIPVKKLTKRQKDLLKRMDKDDKHDSKMARRDAARERIAKKAAAKAAKKAAKKK